MASSSESQYTDSASLDYLAISIPAGKFGFGFGIIPYTSVGYQIETSGPNTEGNNMLNRYEGEGGIYQTYLSVGVPLFSFLSIGASAQYNFGNLFYRTGQYAEGVENGTFLTNQSNVSGFSYQFSIQSNIPLYRRKDVQTGHLASGESHFIPSSDFWNQSRALDN